MVRGSRNEDPVRLGQSGPHRPFRGREAGLAHRRAISRSVPAYNIRVNRRFFLLFPLFACACFAAVTRVDVTERGDVLQGVSLGSAGPYERIAGKVYFAVDPKLAPNRIIADIDLAPRNAEGKVEFSADGGTTWQTTKLGKDYGKYSFRQWEADFEAAARGSQTLLTRCTNTNNVAQPMTPNWNPNGFMRNVVETVQVNVA